MIGRDTEVIVTGFGDRDTGGGTFRLAGDEIERLDRLAATGVALSPDGTRLARLLRGGGDLVVTDAAGVLLYRRIDDLTDPHDLLWTRDQGLLAVSTDRNRILWLTEDGAVARTWQAPGEGDAWHLNCLARDGERVVCSAFGRFGAHRGWNVPGASDGTGILFDVATGEDVVAGLDRPHHPRRVEDGWLVCDSAAGGLLHVGDDGTRRPIPLGGFTRGLAIGADAIHVGLSAPRGVGAAGTAQLLVLDPTTYEERERHVLPCREVYDVAEVPAPLVDGLRTGFRTNPLRAGDADQHALFAAAGVEPEQLWPTSDPLPPAACRTRLTCTLPATLVAGEAHRVAWRLENRGGAVLTSAAPHPVSVSWRWFDAGAVVAQGERVTLPRSLPPGEEAEGEAWIVPPPDRTGTLDLAVACVQEHVAWFDDLHPDNGVRGRVVVTG